VDLGCGYGMALSFAAFGDSSRRLVGCDLDAHRIAAAREALSTLNADLSVADIRHFELPPAGLILILDVLQYLPADEQLALLKRCCAALAPHGILIFRVHDRERGLWSTITMAFDRLIFACGRAGVRPLMLAAAEYRSVLENAGMQVEERRFETVCPWLISYSLQRNWQKNRSMKRRPRHDGPFHALGRPLGRRSSGVGGDF
jgi:trans-aconitate methyltransferase